MAQTDTLLLELGTEELPAKGLQALATALGQQLSNTLSKAGLEYTGVTTFATPRRLAVLIQQLAAQQLPQSSTRKGPSLAAAFDSVGEPTPAAIGFARSCNVDIKALAEEQGSLVYHQTSVGQATIALLPALIQQVLANLPCPKSMRWGSREDSFLRPVRWLAALFGNTVIDIEWFGLTSNRLTYGHRFHAPHALTLHQADEYPALLEQQAYVQPDFAKRRAAIQEQILQLCQPLAAQALVPEALLDEVTGLVEWPVAQLAQFAPEFLSIPAETLISAMQMHQQCFALLNKKGELLPHFITVSNIVSKDPTAVIKGNERVMHARLSDAAFFYRQDCQQSLPDWLERLTQVTFQNKLGSLQAKSERIANLASYIAQQLAIDTQQANRAGLLAKADLLSAMVGEFPELQGIMGYYYALHKGEPEPVAMAIREHYLPRFAGDQLPASLIGCAVALADRIDSLVGLFAIKQPPTGDKDPFGLRRAAIGVVRIIIEHKLQLDLHELLQQAQQGYSDVLENANVVEDVLQFINERMRVWLQEQDIAAADSFAAVISQQPDQPYDCSLRLQAINVFRRLPAAQTLAAANKRVNNLLNQLEKEGMAKLLPVDEKLLQIEAEHLLAQQVAIKTQEITPLIASKRYNEALTCLAELNEPINHFFDQVMVMVEDKHLSNNRLALLASVRALFMQIADISVLKI